MSPVAAHADHAFAGPIAHRRPVRTVDRQRRTGFPWLRLWLGSGAVTTLVVFAGQPEPAPIEYTQRAAIDPAPVRAPPPDWEAIERPAAIYAVAAADVQYLRPTYEARRDRDGGREDILTFGSAADDMKPYARIAARLSAEPDLQATSFYIDLARRAADAGLSISRSTPADGLPTKFGAAEVADVALSGDNVRACLAVRFSRPEAALHVGGWLCGAGGQPPSQRQLACLVDGLSLRSAENAALSALFVKAERQRDASCIPPPRVAEAKPPPARNGRRR